MVRGRRWSRGGVGVSGGGGEELEKHSGAEPRTDCGGGDHRRGGSGDN